MRKHRSSLAVVLAAIACGAAGVTASCATDYGDASPAADASTSNADAITTNDVSSDVNTSPSSGDGSSADGDTGRADAAGLCRSLFSDDFETGMISQRWTVDTVNTGSVAVVAFGPGGHAVQCKTSSEKDRASLSFQPIGPGSCPFRVSFSLNISGSPTTNVTVFQLALGVGAVEQTIGLNYQAGSLVLSAAPSDKQGVVPFSQGAFHAVSIEYNPDESVIMTIDKANPTTIATSAKQPPLGFVVGAIVVNGVSTVMIDDVTAQ
jgi:hypothetical protein